MSSSITSPQTSQPALDPQPASARCARIVSAMHLRSSSSS